MEEELREAFRLYDKEGVCVEPLEPLYPCHLHNTRKFIGTRLQTSSFCIGNGYITTATLREILAALDDKLTSEDLDGIISEIDTDGSGTVDFDGKLLASLITQHCLGVYFFSLLLNYFFCRVHGNDDRRVEPLYLHYSIIRYIYFH